MFIGTCIIAIVDEWKTNLMSLAILFHLLCAQHVSDINISIIRNLRLCWWITTSVVLFCKDGCFGISVTLRCVVVCVWCDVFLCFWAHNKWNKIASDIKLVFHSSATFSSSHFCPYDKRKSTHVCKLKSIHFIGLGVIVSTRCLFKYSRYHCIFYLQQKTITVRSLMH